ncbi:hypothetical protein KL938_001180 [Ogataea parapolymorpha]|nr:hypothetical protein KL938_001180 [Ogataea parapolymorpha]
MSQLILSALRDVIPTLPEPYPREVVDYANYMYISSKQTCPLAAQMEIARFHLCCFLAVEKLKDKFDLPDPNLNRIPAPKRKAAAVLEEFRNQLTGRKRHVEPPITPSKRRIIELATPESTPGKRRANALTPRSTPSKTRNMLATPESTPRSLKTEIKNEQPLYIGSAAKSLQDKLLAAADEIKGPSKRGRKKGFKMLSMADRSLNDDTIITTAHLISFCNKFYLPEDITKNILKTYTNYYYRTKSPWGLLCGLVSIAFLRLNREKVDAKMGFKTQFFKNLQVHENGGLKYNELLDWIALVEKLCETEKWVRDLEDKDLLTTKSKLPFGLPTLNSFIGNQVCYYSDGAIREYENWIGSIKKQTST